MTEKILNFIHKHNVRPFIFILIYAWMFDAVMNHSISALVLSILHVIIFFLVVEND
jgi:hypothetical protein